MPSDITAQLDSTASDTAAAVEAGRLNGTPNVLEPGKTYVVTTADGDMHVIERDLDIYRDQPRRKTGTVTVTDATSFNAYLTKHQVPQTEIYADADASTVTAVINAHEHVSDAEDDLGQGFAGWGDHRLRLVLRQTPTWTAWTVHDRKYLSQAQFAEHLEDNLADIVTPPGADMLELAQNFQATRKGVFESSKRLSSGSTQLVYREDETASAGKKGQLAIPERFELALTPYQGSRTYKVGARLRYRIDDATLRLAYVLDRPDEVLRAAFADVVDDIQTGGGAESGRVIYQGTPMPARGS